MSELQDLARRCRQLRRLDRHADPERFAVAVEDLAERIEALDRQRKPPRSPRYWRAA
ncbi:MAG: hypothetical protein ACLFU0_09405 [Alphaproteobacteria bacterium]